MILQFNSLEEAWKWYLKDMVSNKHKIKNIIIEMKE
jgi:hypothetical protein